MDNQAMNERAPEVKIQEEQQQQELVIRQPSYLHNDLWTREERAALLQVLTENDEVLRRLADA